LNTSPRYFFRKEDKLKSRKAIQTLFSKGNHFTVFPLKVYWLHANEQAVLQAGISVSSRNFKKAVDRNRIKRLIREAYRLQKNQLQEQLIKEEKQLSLFIIYIGKDLPEYSAVFDNTGAIIKKLGRIIHGNY
jgi:ribonuclease P protein component